MSDTITNRHGDEIRVGQLWLDNPARTARRTLRVDGLEDAGALGTAAICTVVAAYNQETGEITAPGRVVSIKVDSLHATPSGKGYHLATAAMTVRVADRRTSPVGHATVRTVTIAAVCPTCAAPRGVPANHNFHDDGEWLSCDKWENPCGHVDRYDAVLVEAERAQATTVSEG